MIGLPNFAHFSESRADVLVAGFRCSRFDCSAHNFGIRSVLLIMAEQVCSNDRKERDWVPAEGRDFEHAKRKLVSDTIEMEAEGEHGNE